MNLFVADETVLTQFCASVIFLGYYQITCTTGY